MARPTDPGPRRPAARSTGYHSPQVDVDVRLNTNESPFPPPAGVARRAARRAGRRRLPPLSRPRAPRPCAPRSPSCTACAPDQVFAANGSNEVLQTLCSPTAATGRTVAVFEPTYALHSHIARITGTGVVAGARGRRLRARPRRGRPRARPPVADDHLPLLAQQPDRPGRAAGRSSSGLLDRRAGAGRRRRGLRPVRAVVGARRWSTTTRPLVVVRTFSKTWSMAAARLGYLVGPGVAGRRSSSRWCCRTTSTPSSRSPGRSPCASAPRWRRGSRRSSRSGAGSSAALRRPAGRDVAVGRQLRPLPAASGRRRRGVAGAWSTARCSCATALVARPRRLPAGHRRHARRERRPSSPP